MSDSADVQRSLGRIEGGLAALNEKIDILTTRFGDHLNDDQKNFSSTRASVYSLRDEIKAQFVIADTARNQHLNEQDVKLDALMMARAVLRGQLTLGQKVIAWIGSGAVFLFGVWEAYLKLK